MTSNLAAAAIPERGPSGTSRTSEAKPGMPPLHEAVEQALFRPVPPRIPSIASMQLDRFRPPFGRTDLRGMCGCRLAELASCLANSKL